ncbi:MAG: hypothetical protein QCH96_01405 [Candidatus Thermoplasmatota archaeon]|jgi:hypothetical protein|nr:hypothetical protein [Candidatus Thermoplasmatota archaeon]
METRTTNIWIWIQNGEIYKSISSPEEGTICIYDEHDTIILKRTGLTRLQVKQIEDNIMRYGAKKLSPSAEPFRFLGK